MRRLTASSFVHLRRDCVGWCMCTSQHLFMWLTSRRLNINQGYVRQCRRMWGFACLHGWRLGIQEAQRKPGDLCRRRKCAGLAVHVLACLHVRLHTRYTSLTTRLVRYDAPDQPCSMGNVRALGAAGKAVVNMCFAVWRTPCCPQACGRFARPRNLARMRRTLHIAGIKFIPPGCG